MKSRAQGQESTSGNVEAQGGSEPGDGKRQEDLGRGLKLGDPLNILCPSAAHPMPTAHGGSGTSAGPQADRRGVSEQIDLSRVS